MLPNYAQKMEEVRNDIVTMAKFAYESLKLSYEGLKNSDVALFESARSNRVKHLGYLANGVDNNIVIALALYTPEASELRALIALLKSTNELMRIGNAAKSYAAGMEEAIKQGINIEPLKPFISELHLSAMRSVEALIHLLEDFSMDSYRAIMVEEDKSDELATLLQKEIVDRLMDQQESLPSYLKLLRRIRKLEKAVDSTENIAKLLMYANEGGKIEFN